MSPLLLLIVLALVLLNGFFVASEFALVRVRRERLEQDAGRGSKLAARALEQVKQIDAYLAACQLGITMASLGLGWVGEPVIASILEPLLGDIFSHGIAVFISAVIAFSLITLAHITAGEQVPKMMAISGSLAAAKWTSVPLQWFKVAFWPAIWVVNSISNWIVRRLGSDIKGGLDEEATSEDLRALVLRGALVGRLGKSEAGMLSGVFDLHEKVARQVMTPIPAVVTALTTDSVEETLKRCIASGHTRLLVIEEENPDKIRGIVHLNSLTRLMMDEGVESKIESAVHPVPIVPETRPLDELLADLQRERATMAAAINEYGRIEGIVTVEDIVEEVVGEIEDETDLSVSLRQLATGDWYVRGHVSLDDIADAGIELPIANDAYTSIGGFVFDELGRLPKRGDVVNANGYSIRVESVRENRIEAVRIRKRQLY